MQYLIHVCGNLPKPIGAALSKRSREGWKFVLLVWLITALSSFFSGNCQAGPYQEAPMLRELVEQGKLPPVEDRLPEQPAIVQPYEKIGVYGGQLRTLTSSPDNLDEAQYMNFEPLLRFASDSVTIVPNVVTHWEMAPDARSITLFLRKGMRWSDGAPVTADDVLFAWYDVILNKDITLPTLIPSQFVVGGKPMEIERIDDFTVRLVFAEPYGAICYFLTRTIAGSRLVQPKHYLKNYHSKYTPMEQIMAKARQAGFAEWFELFREVNYESDPVGSLSPQTPPDYPTIGPWHVVEAPATGNTILARNPYYWKVDPEGNQLPYIDSIHATYIGNPEARNLMFVTGNIDFGGVYSRLANSPLFLSNRRKGRYSVYFWREVGNRVSYYFNQTHRDLVLRKIFQDRRFRIALSLAINRREINEIVYFGKCIPMQDTVGRNCNFFEPEFERAYAEYNLEEANRLLDEMGLKRKGVGGWRYRPDGRQLTITLDVTGSEPYMTTALLVKEYWQDLGVLLNVRVVESTLLSLRMWGNLADVVGIPNQTYTEITMLQQRLYGIFYWAPLWHRWLRTQGEQGEEPPQEIKDLHKLWEELPRESDPKERVRLGKILVRSQAENLWGIGTVGEAIKPIIVSNRLYNVPQYMKNKNGQLLEGQRTFWDWSWLATVLHHAEQFYIKED